MELVGQAGEVSTGQRRDFVLEGMCRLLGASAAVMVCAEEFYLGGQNRVTRVFSTGWTGREREAYLASIAAGACGEPVLVPLGMHAGPRAYRRRDLVSTREWYKTPWVREELHAAHLDEGIYTARPVEGSSATECIGIYRTPGDRAFTEEDREIVPVHSASDGPGRHPSQRQILQAGGGVDAVALEHPAHRPEEQHRHFAHRIAS